MEYPLDAPRGEGIDDLRTEIEMLRAQRDAVLDLCDAAEHEAWRTQSPAMLGTIDHSLPLHVDVGEIRVAVGEEA